MTSPFFLGLLLPEPGCACPYPKEIAWGFSVDHRTATVEHIHTECKACRCRAAVAPESVLLKPITLRANGEIELTK